LAAEGGGSLPEHRRHGQAPTPIRDRR